MTLEIAPCADPGRPLKLGYIWYLKYHLRSSIIAQPRNPRDLDPSAVLLPYHKIQCNSWFIFKMPGRAGRNKNKDPFYYWNYVAITKPEAQTLASRLGLDFPAGLQDAPKSGLMYDKLRPLFYARTIIIQPTDLIPITTATQSAASSPPAKTHPPTTPLSSAPSGPQKPDQ